jgi:hypothetical protein
VLGPIKDAPVFVYELDIKNLGELWFFLFRSKKCPVCYSKLERVAVLPEYSSGFETEWTGTGVRSEYVHKTKEAVRYRCHPCHAYYSLTDLAARA